MTYHTLHAEDLCFSCTITLGVFASFQSPYYAQGTAEVSQTKPQPQQHEYPLSTEALISTNEGAPFGKGGAGSQDVAVIVFTSGTAGPAKGVCLTHAALSFQVGNKAVQFYILDRMPGP